MENNAGTAATPQHQQAAPEVKPEKKSGEEFSLAWHVRILAVIYVALFVLYIVLKLTLK